jgi:hypothetical protein
LPLLRLPLLRLPLLRLPLLRLPLLRLPLLRLLLLLRLVRQLPQLPQLRLLLHMGQQHVEPLAHHRLLPLRLDAAVAQHGHLRQAAGRSPGEQPMRTTGQGERQGAVCGGQALVLQSGRPAAWGPQRAWVR